MKLEKTITTGAVTIAAVSGAANAAFADGMEGFYAGVMVGGYVGSLPFYDGDYTFGANSTEWNLGSFGGFVGHNWHVNGSIYGGIEIAANNGAVSVYDTDYAINLMVDVKGRIGTMIGDNAFVYGFAGFSTGLMDADGLGYGIFGANIGGGVDYFFTDNVGIGAEFVHRTMIGHDYGDGPMPNSSVNVRAIFTF